MKAQPVDWTFGKKKPFLHIGLPCEYYTLYSPSKAYPKRTIEGEEIGSLIGCFRQGKLENIVVFSDVFGISMAAVSALMLFSRFWDAINDPIVGGLTDKTKTRWGRYRPWLLVAAPITAVLLMLTFWAHPDWPDTAKIIYMIITWR